MLGEAALTTEDAKRYRIAYEDAIHAIGKASNHRGVYEGPGISIKLSALHPRYSRAQHARVMDELYPVLRALTLLAQQYDIGLNIDAEEADRLELSLDLLERLCFEPALAGWNGIGFVIQGYQKRCPFVIDFVVDLARRSRHRLMVRLVKGAYWDSEIKRAQIDGLDGYPVYTRKAYTDVSYLACARKLLDAPEAVYPQFATHNAHTLAAIYTMADPTRYQPGQYEFQCLHGMGEPLYEQVVGPLGRPCRIYAPVGTHETLLAYLVRRLLENGANTSFVNRIADPTIPLEALVEDPVATVERMARNEGAVGLPHPAIPLPAALYGEQRANSQGLDLANDDSLRLLGETLRTTATEPWRAEPLLAEADRATKPLISRADVLNPADHRDVVGQVREATLADVESAVSQAQGIATTWAATSPAARAAVLDRAADLLEAQQPRLLGLLAREAGKTYANGIAEVREAVDFLRYYAAQARTDFSNDTHRALGPMVCISPWNFPLAIFTGQVAAALAAGNPVLAKPAEQTPLVAAEAIRVLWQAGVPRAAVQLLPGRGETVGAALVADARVQGVMFTGSTEVARILQKTLSTRLGANGAPVPLIAETGGQNAMIVDSSALVEQVVADVMASAFDSAGQRCSALRVLCVQEEAADRLIEMLKGAMAESCIGNPARLAIDVGPVIDAEARDNIERHIATMRSRGRRVYRQGPRVRPRHAPGHLRDADADRARQHRGTAARGVRTGAAPGALPPPRPGRAGRPDQRHGLRAHAGRAHAHRRDHRADRGARQGGQCVREPQYRGRGGGRAAVRRRRPVGHGAEGGRAALHVPHAVEAAGRCAGARHCGCGPGQRIADARRCIACRADGPGAMGWTETNRDALATQCRRFGELSRAGSSRTLTGPTGERNVYTLQPREAVLCLADAEADRLVQLAAVLSVLAARRSGPRMPAHCACSQRCRSRCSNRSPSRATGLRRPSCSMPCFITAMRRAWQTSCIASLRGRGRSSACAHSLRATCGHSARKPCGRTCLERQHCGCWWQCELDDDRVIRRVHSGRVHRPSGTPLRECPPGFALLLDFAAGSTRCPAHLGTLWVNHRSTTALKALAPMVGSVSRNKGGGEAGGHSRNRAHRRRECRPEQRSLLVERRIDRHAIPIDQPIGLVRHPDHAHQFAEHLGRHARLLRARVMARDAVAAAVGHAHREVDHFLDHRVERAGRHHLFQARPRAPERRGIVGQVLPEVVDIGHVARGLDVVEHGLDLVGSVRVVDRLGLHRIS
jgi:RHH-type proline utilization regulon transcriptional repressor/proline dehydrogenase/delta 1-pyrroline-5-carboxylate dehydrogenase